MNNKLKIAACFLLTFAITVSCLEEQKESSTSEEQTQQPINPNGDSELTLLMREIFDEAELIKKQIANGEPIEITLDHEKILTAHATEPETSASLEYKTFANLYLQSIKDLKSAETGQLVGAYDKMVKSCMTCHQALCPGPLVRIRKLQ